jgi:1-acyl-sn-glycerol-3-phosphate acyltransferase
MSDNETPVSTDNENNSQASARATNEIPAQETEVSEQDIEQQLKGLVAELNALAKRLQTLAPYYATQEYSPRRMRNLVDESLNRCKPEIRLGAFEWLQNLVGGGIFDPETWAGFWYLLTYSAKLQADIVKRRFTGEYDTDAWGMDWEFYESVVPLLTFLYSVYWRVETTGVDNIPRDGRALLVSNHSGQLPWDGAMIGAAVWNEHPSQRLVRCLYGPWFATVPFLSAIFIKMGHAVGTVANGSRLLGQDELVAVFPEGSKGAGKLFRERYQLADFGRGGFVKMALSTQTPILPVAVVGAEETYISIAKSPTLARLSGVPFFPITPTFPWLGPLGLVPLPTKWYVDFGEPIPADEYGPDAASDLMLIARLRDQVRDNVQEMVHLRLAQRRSVFLG